MCISKMYTQTYIVLKLILVNTRTIKGALCDFGGGIQIQGANSTTEEMSKNTQTKSSGERRQEKRAATQKHQEQSRWEREEDKA